MKIKKGDKVKVLRGKDKGKTGKVEKVYSKSGRVLVAGVNMYKKHVKPRQGQPGGIVEITKPLEAFKLMAVCPSCGKSVRVGYQLNGGVKERICKKCGVSMDKKNKT